MNRRISLHAFVVALLAWQAAVLITESLASMQSEGGPCELGVWRLTPGGRSYNNCAILPSNPYEPYCALFINANTSVANSTAKCTHAATCRPKKASACVPFTYTKKGISTTYDLAGTCTFLDCYGSVPWCATVNASNYVGSAGAPGSNWDNCVC